MTTVPPHWVETIALQAARDIGRIPADWPEVRRKAATQVIVTDAIKSVCSCGTYCQDVGGGICRYEIAQTIGFRE